ncbi:cytochrome P450 [Nocardia carnea]|uniref:cytochrome P450 n=1 Tax=Nocardia carnea TaxID=37328 RepID=UPI002458F62E|nr:cytochrome P450 [Nocardia carnea]
MATPTTPACPVTHGSPDGTHEDRIALHAPEFAADPHRTYDLMRKKFGSLAPVELAPGVPATLVIGYYTAVRVLHDPDHFRADPRVWQQTLSPDCPIKALVEWRPNALRSSGPDHARYRSATIDAIDAVDLHKIHRTVSEFAVPLINSFCDTGHADLISEYVFPTVFNALNAMVGCSPDIGEELAAAFADIFDGCDAAAANATIGSALSRLIELKRSDPDEDIATALVEHPTRLTDEELIHQLVTIYGAGSEPGANLITNALRLMLTDDRFGSNLLGGQLSARAALDEVLARDSPLANYCLSYPRQPILLDGTWLPAHQPVVISMAACNNDPAVSGGDITGNRSHLSFSVGPHACPAEKAVLLIAESAIEQLLDALPDMELACRPEELVWRPGAFHRSLHTLPVEFPPTPPLNPPLS